MDTETWLTEVESLTSERLSAAHVPKELTVVFDPECELCRRCRVWMLQQAAHVPLWFLPCTAKEAQERYGSIPWIGDELIVISETRELWVGPAAFLTCLWALVEWREWSYRLAGPAFVPLAERFFHGISNNRRSLSAFLSHQCESGSCRSYRA